MPNPPLSGLPNQKTTLCYKNQVLLKNKYWRTTIFILAPQFWYILIHIQDRVRTYNCSLLYRIYMSILRTCLLRKKPMLPFRGPLGISSRLASQPKRSTLVSIPEPRSVATKALKSWWFVEVGLGDHPSGWKCTWDAILGFQKRLDITLLRTKYTSFTILKFNLELQHEPPRLGGWSWKSSLLSFHIRFCECTTLNGWKLVPVTPVDGLCIPVFAGLSTVPSGPGFQPPNSIIGIILSGIKCSSLPLPGPPAAHSSCGNFFVASTLHDHWPRCNTMAHQHRGVAAGQDLRKFSFWNSQTSTLEFHSS